MTQFWRAQPITWGKRLIFVVLIMGGMGYGVLKLAERSKEPIRQGLQDYLSQATGHVAEITDMKHVALVPNVVFDMEGILVRDGDATLASVRRMRIAVPLVNVFFGKQDYLGFEIETLEAASGYILPKKLTLDYAGISDSKKGEFPPVFLIKGTYNALPVHITAEIDRKTSRGGASVYRLKKKYPMTFKFGGLAVEGMYVQGDNGSPALENVHFDYKGQKGTFDLAGLGRKSPGVKVAGTLDGVVFNAELTKSGDSYMLRIMPETDDPRSVTKIKKLVTGVQKDIGLDEKDKKFSIHVVPGKSIAE